MIIYVTQQLQCIENSAKDITSNYEFLFLIQNAFTVDTWIVLRSSYEWLIPSPSETSLQSHLYILAYLTGSAHIEINLVLRVKS